jgi:small subunit ribosomal protein S6
MSKKRAASLYETIFIARQDMAPSQVDALTEKFSTVIREGEGVVGKTEYCGLRTLAYEIRRNAKGHYVLLNITAEPQIVKEMERQMGNNEDVLRFLTVVVDEHQEGPSALLKAARNSNLRDVSISFGEDEEGSENEAKE